MWYERRPIVLIHRDPFVCCDPMSTCDKEGSKGSRTTTMIVVLSMSEYNLLSRLGRTMTLAPNVTEEVGQQLATIQQQGGFLSTLLSQIIVSVVLGSAIVFVLM